MLIKLTLSRINLKKHVSKISVKSHKFFSSYRIYLEVHLLSGHSVYCEWCKMKILNKLLEIKQQCLTVARTANKSCPHADVFMPLDWVKANVSGDKWRAEVVISRCVAVRISSEFLQQ